MAAIPGTIRIPALSAKPSAPPPGSVIFYIKTDNVIYVQDSSGNEYPFASADLITALHGDVSATGPGDAAATVNSVGGSSAANIHSAELAANAATAAATPGTIVLRDGSANFSANIVSLTVLKLLGSSSGILSLAVPASFSDFTLTLPSGPGSVGQALITDGAGILSWQTFQTPGLADGKIWVGNVSNIAAPQTPGGDVSMSNSANFTVNTVGGSSAANIHSAELAANAATDANTASTIVKRDASGNFSMSALLASSASMVGISDIVQLSVKGFSTQTSDIVRVLKSDNTVLFKVDNSGNGTFNGTLAASNFSGSSSGTNTGDVTKTDTDSISLSLSGQNLSATLRLSSDGADAGYVKANATIHSGAGAGLHVEIADGTPVQIGTSNATGSGAGFARFDHVHSHGNQTVGTLHAAATNSVNGFMSSSDKAKLDTFSATAATTGEILISDGTTYNPRTMSGDASILNTGVLTVNSVGGSSAANIHSAELAANAATATNTASTIVKRDSSGNFAAGEVEIQTDLLLDNQASAPSNPTAAVKLYANVSNGFERARVLHPDGTIFAINRDIYHICYNNTGSSLSKGQAVYINGTNSGIPTVALAKADSPNTAPAFGLVYDSVATGNYLRVQIAGTMSGFDTSSFTAGATVYLSAATAGALTSTEPLSPNLSQVIAKVSNSAVSGTVDLTIRSALNTSSGTYRSSFQLGPASGAAEVDLVFNNGNAATLAWNPTAVFKLLLPPTQGAAGTFLNNDGAGNLSWVNPNTNIDGGRPDSVYTSSQFINGGTP